MLQNGGLKMATVCKTCGGPVNRVGNYYVCEYCRNKWEIDSGNDVHAVERANAWAALRDGDFEKAAELFENIIVKEAKNHEAYWGRALALAGIVYVTDMNENKKVPTCNNITEDSFISNKDVQKAISLAPADIADGYKSQAEYIEKVRTEWLEKASKEPAYDVFISFKDSDRENGIERTQDSIDAQDLYNVLVAEGYKVFFSRISLRDKISEQYEPYIYNAIKTAKVMIVFGEKAEYFSSVWIKNEWSRFKTRIEKGEKHKNSLVVVYKNMNPGDLPVVLKSRQCLNASDMTFLSDLTRHIKRVVEESKRNVHLEKIEITGGQISKKATKIENETLQTREIGAGAIAETSVSEKKQFELVLDYCEMDDFNIAKDLIEDVLFNNPNFAEAIWQSLLIKFNAKSDKELKSNINNFNDEDFGIIEKTLNCASQEFASDKLTLLYGFYNYEVEESVYTQILNIILPFDFLDRQNEINKLFKLAIAKQHLKVFNLLIKTLKNTDVAKYINYHINFAEKSSDIDLKHFCIDKVLAVDNGNLDALKLLFKAPVKPMVTDEMVEFLETLLKYSSDVKASVKYVLNETSLSPFTKEMCEFSQKAIKYYPGELEEIENELLEIAESMVYAKFFNEAEYFANLVLSFDTNSARTYRILVLSKANLTSLTEKVISSNEVPEYTKYLSLLSSDERKKIIRSQVMVKTKKYTKFLVSVIGSEDAKDNFPNDWKDIVAIAASYGGTFGLKSDGTVAVNSSGYGMYGQFSVGGWKDIVAIVASSGRTVGLKSDGTVVAAGDFSKKERNVINDWKDIVAIAMNYGTISGLKSDGTVIAVGSFSEKNFKVINDWKDIVAIVASEGGTVGLKSDGTVVAVGRFSEKELNVINDWKDIVAIAATESSTVGLKSDGTVTALIHCLIEEHNKLYEKKFKVINDWKDIVAIAESAGDIVGLKSNGTIVSTNKYWNYKSLDGNIEDCIKQKELEKKEKAEEQARIEKEKAEEQERIKKEKAEEQKRIKRNKQLIVQKEKEIKAFQDERKMLGFFAGKKKKEIDAKILVLKYEIQKLKS